MVATLHGSVLNYEQYTLNQGSDYTIFNTSFANIDTASLKLNIDIDAQAVTGQALVGWHCNAQVTSGGRGYFDLLVNGTVHAGNDGILAVPDGTIYPVSFTRLVTGLTTGTLNTVYLQAKASGGGTMTVYAGAGTGNADVHGQFWSCLL
jgi:hypothetical protein